MSYVVPQHQLYGVGVQVMLTLKVGISVFSEIVKDQGYRHDEGDKLPMITVNDFQEFLLLVRRKLFFEVAHSMLEHIGMFLCCGYQTQSIHQSSDIFPVKVVFVILGACHKLSEGAVMLGTVGHDE